VKKKNKKTKKTETKTVEQDSFFNFFQSHTLKKEPAAQGGAEAKGDEEEDNKIADKIDEDFEIGNEFKE